MKRCVIVGAAPMDSYDALRQAWRTDDYIIAADGGYTALQAAGITPSVLVADFDSMTGMPTCPKDTEIVRLPVRKDETDTLAAARLAFDRGYREFLLWGCLGGRLDHTWANFQVMADLTAKGCRVTMADDCNEVTLWTPGTYHLPPRPDCAFSLLAYDPIVTGVTVKKAAYTVENVTLTSDNPLGVSNGFLPGETVEISFTGGRLLAFYCKT